MNKARQVTDIKSWQRVGAVTILPLSDAKRSDCAAPNVYSPNMKDHDAPGARDDQLRHTGTHAQTHKHIRQ